MAKIKTCFWCLKPFDKKINFDKEKDTMEFSSYELCEECKKILGSNIHVIGVTSQQMLKSQPALFFGKHGESYYPTGSMFVATDEWVKDFLCGNGSDELTDTIIKNRVFTIPQELMDVLVEKFKEEDVNEIVDDPDLIEKQGEGVISKE